MTLAFAQVFPTPGPGMANKAAGGGGTHTPPTVVNHFDATPGPVTLSGILAGDVLYIAEMKMSDVGAVTISCTPACTQISSQADAVNNAEFLTGYYVAAGGETSMSVTDSGSNTYHVVIFQLRGVDNVTVQDVAANVLAFAAGSSATSGSLTPGHNNALIISTSVLSPSAINNFSSASSTSTATGTTNAWTTTLFTDSSFCTGARCGSMSVGIASQTTAGAITVTSSQTNADASPRTSLTTAVFKSATP